MGIGTRKDTEPMTCFLQVFFMERQGYWGLTVRYKEATGLAGPVSSVHMSRGLTKWTLRAQGEVGRHCWVRVSLVETAHEPSKSDL